MAPSMGWLYMLFLASCAYAQVRNYEVKGLIAPERLPEDAQLFEVQNLVQNELKESNFFVHRVAYDEMDSGILTFIAYFESAENSATLIEKYKRSQGFTIVFWRDITTNKVIDKDSFPSKPKLTAETTIPCFNGGTLLHNGTCACGPFTSGHKCQTVRCQRKGIPEGGDRCYCPPGWYAKFCEIRGCRPPLSDNLDVDKRSFMLVLPITPSMADVRTSLQNSLIDAFKKIQGRGFDNYILNMFVPVNDSFYMSYITVARSPQALVNNIQNIVVNAQTQPSSYPLKQAIVDVQQYTRQMHPNSIIFAFTDSPDKTAGPVSYTLNQNTLEIQAMQTTMLWRSRIIMFFVNNPKMSVDTTLESYDTYRRIATFSHGDLFSINQNEVPIVINNVLPHLDRPEYIDVRSFAQCNNLTLDLVRDDPNQNVVVFITIDNNPNTPNNVTITAWDTFLGITEIPNSMNGPYWATFVIPPGWDSVRINVSPKAVCSAKAFISSPSTILWAYSDDDYIDVGNMANLAEIEMMITLQPVKFPLFSNFSVEFTNPQTNQPFTWPMKGIVRNEPDCTFVYKVPDLPSCAVGPFTQKYTFSFSAIGKYMRRIHPGFCSHYQARKGNETIVQQYPTKGNGTGNTCYLLNTAAMGGKLHDFRQVIFAVEFVQEMNNITDQLSSRILDVTKKITEADAYRRQFSFVIFDSVGWKAIVSDYDPDQFSKKVQESIVKLNDDALHISNGAFSMDAIYHSIELEIVSPAIIHVLTMSSPKSSDFYRVLPTDIQVNFFYFSQDLTVPTYNDFRTMQKQTGGRLLAVSELPSTDIFTSTIYQNNLLVDTGYQDCSKGIQQNFSVESAASRIELTFLASDPANTISLYDGKGAAVDLSSAYLKNKATSLIEITTDGKAPGTWTATVTAKSSCFLQVRAVSDVNVGVGFTADIHEDFVAHHPFSKRGTNDSSSIVVRATSNSNIQQVIVQPTDFNTPWSGGNDEIAVTKFTSFDTNTCAYQFRSDLVQIPINTNSMAVQVTGTDANGTPFQRVFNYYTPDSDKGQECNGGKVDTFGQCACPGNFTGEYCWDRVCAYGSTPSRGICMCQQFYIGPRCENVNTEVSTATEPPFPPSTQTTPTMPTPGPGSNSPSSTYIVSFLISFFILYIRIV